MDRMLLTSVFLLLLSFAPLAALEERNVDPAVNLSRQISLFPQEKIHLHTDRSTFLTGDTVWFRAYVLNAYDHVPDTSSRFVYVELVSPLNYVEKRVKIRNRNGVYAGFIPLPENFPDGEYVLRAYTHYMMNLEEDYFFRKKIRVYAPFFLHAELGAEFRFTGTDGRNGRADVWMQEKFSGERYHPDHPLIYVNHPFDELRWNDVRYNARDTSVTAWFRLSEQTDKQNIMMVDFDRYRKYVAMESPVESFEVRFFPESGYLVEGHLNRIGWDARQNNGLPCEVRGTVYDSEDNEVATFASEGNGMGGFSLFPEAGKSYYAICSNEKGETLRCALPNPSAAAYGIRVNHRNGNIDVSVVGPEKADRDLYLFIHLRGRPVYSGLWDRKTRSISFDEKEMPAGVMSALLLDESMNILNERLFYSYGATESEVTLHVSGKLEARTPLRLNLTVKDPSGHPLNGRFSVSVTDHADVPADTLYNILSTLYLNSELPGFIENPGRYLGTDSESKIKLDHLLMIHGWRRYHLPSVFRGRFRSPSYALEIGDEISGTVEKIAKREPVEGSEVNLAVFAPFYADRTATDANGRFYFKGFDFPDSTELLLQAYTKRGKEGVRIRADRQRFPAVRIPFLYPEPGVEETIREADTYLGEKIDRMYIDEYGMRVIEFAKINVVANRWPEHYLVFGKSARARIDAEKIARLEVDDIYQLLGALSGVHIDGADNLKPLGLFGGSGMEVRINNMVMSHPDFLEFVDPKDILLLEVVYADGVAENAGQILGSINDISRMGKSVINIILKNEFTPQNRNRKKKLNTTVIRPLGYQKPVEFYSPTYDTPFSNSKDKGDLRTTVFWSPDGRTDPNGQAAFEFFAADSPSVYFVVVEGMTDDGKIIYHTQKITAE